MSETELVRLKPRRIRVVCWSAAVALVVVFGLVATSLSGPTGDGYGSFQRGDQIAMIGLGIFGALGLPAVHPSPGGGGRAGHPGA